MPGGRGYDAGAMGQIDEQKERRRLAELYANLEEGELEEIAADAGSLTQAAREALRSEMLGRRMRVAPDVTGGTEASASSEARGKEREDPNPRTQRKRFDGARPAQMQVGGEKRDERQAVPQR